MRVAASEHSRSAAVDVSFGLATRRDGVPAAMRGGVRLLFYLNGETWWCSTGPGQVELRRMLLIQVLLLSVSGAAVRVRA